MSKKRSLFGELVEGMDALDAAHRGKITLRTFEAEVPDAVIVSPAEIRAVREASNASQAVMAQRLRVNARTYQNWEQGKAKPNAQAAVLIKLVEKYPQTLALLETL